ncbi:MAG: hypothetical protein ABSF63_13305 [Candidatus Bathyarchaeia archaeon]
MVNEDLDWVERDVTMPDGSLKRVRFQIALPNDEPAFDLAARAAAGIPEAVEELAYIDHYFGNDNQPTEKKQPTKYVTRRQTTKLTMYHGDYARTQVPKDILPSAMNPGDYEIEWSRWNTGEVTAQLKHRKD